MAKEFEEIIDDCGDWFCSVARRVSDGLWVAYGVNRDVLISERWGGEECVAKNPYDAVSGLHKKLQNRRKVTVLGLIIACGKDFECLAQEKDGSWTARGRVIEEDKTQWNRWAKGKTKKETMVNFFKEINGTKKRS